MTGSDQSVCSHAGEEAWDRSLEDPLPKESRQKDVKGGQWLASAAGRSVGYSRKAFLTQVTFYSSYVKYEGDPNT